MVVNPSQFGPMKHFDARQALAEMQLGKLRRDRARLTGADDIRGSTCGHSDYRSDHPKGHARDCAFCWFSVSLRRRRTLVGTI